MLRDNIAARLYKSKEETLLEQDSYGAAIPYLSELLSFGEHCLNIL